MELAADRAGVQRSSLLTIDELGVELRMNPRHAWQLVKDGKIRALRHGKRILVPREALQDYIDKLPAYT